MEQLTARINELKAIKTDNYRSLPIENKRSIYDAEKREVKGYAIVWDSKNSYNESVRKGATQNSLNARGVGSDKNPILLLWQHKSDKPIGRMVELYEDEYGLFFRAELYDTKFVNDEVIPLLNEGIRQLSYGFNYIWDKVEYDEVEDTFILSEIRLIEISIVTFSSDENAQLRNFADYQKDTFLQSLDLRTLENIKKLVDSEIESRDEHSTKIDEPNIDDNKSNVKLF